MSVIVHDSKSYKELWYEKVVLVAVRDAQSRDCQLSRCISVRVGILLLYRAGGSVGIPGSTLHQTFPLGRGSGYVPSSDFPTPTSAVLVR